MTIPIDAGPNPMNTQEELDYLQEDFNVHQLIEAHQWDRESMAKVILDQNAKLEKLEADPQFTRFIENSFFARLTRELLGGHVLLYRSVLWNKAPQRGMAVPWPCPGSALAVPMP